MRAVGVVAKAGLDRAASHLPLGLDNYAISDDYRQLQQASRNFLKAQLRKESGAAIGKEEEDNAFATFLPMPGDDEKTRANKRQARQTLKDAMITAAGAAYEPKAPAAPAGVDPTLWQHMTPEERALWQK